MAARKQNLADLLDQFGLERVQRKIKRGITDAALRNWARKEFPGATERAIAALVEKARQSRQAAKGLDDSGKRGVISLKDVPSNPSQIPRIRVIVRLNFDDVDTGDHQVRTVELDYHNPPSLAQICEDAVDGYLVARSRSQRESPPKSEGSDPEPNDINCSILFISKR